MPVFAMNLAHGFSTKSWNKTLTNKTLIDMTLI
jgi:hypothetical protein